MPIISFANPKGGAGKTTTALLLATELAEKGFTVTIVDADPERWISQWAEMPGRPASIDIVSDVTEDNIVDRIDEVAVKTQFVIVDLEGTASLTVAQAVSISDLVIVPVQGSTMDAKGGVKTLRLIRTQGRTARREIPHAVVLTRTSAAIQTRDLKDVQQQLAEAGVPVFETAIVERAAFRALFVYGGTISNLNPVQVSSIDKALANARDFAAEVIRRLKNG